MPKKVEVSLKGIGKQIDLAGGQLSAAARKAKSRREKKKLAAKIRKLKKVKALVVGLCRRTYTVIVPTV